MPTSSPAVEARERRHRPGGRVMTWVGAAIVAATVLTCLVSIPYTFGRVPDAVDGGTTATSPRRYEATNPDLGLLPPAWAAHAPDEAARLEQYTERSGDTPLFILGTDRLGRDVLVRCLAGGGISLAIGLCAAAIAVLIGTVYGSIAGYMGGRVDAIMMRVVDVFYGLPYILLVVLLAVAVEGIIERVDAGVFEAQQAAVESGDAAEAPAWLTFLQSHREALNVVTLLIAIGSVSWLTMARVIRGEVLSLKQRPFMEACRAIGVPVRRQFTRHMIPNLLGPIVVYATLTVPTAILSESFLSFLGIGVREPLPSWGNLAADGLNEINVVRARWWLPLWPCLIIAVTLLALNFVGEGLKEAFDPRRRFAAVE